MDKLFPVMPDECEHFNPEVFPSEWFDSQGDLIFTFDENGEFHSYNDAPAFADTKSKNKRNFMWYNHGVLERKNGLAPFIYIENDVDRITYMTSLDGKTAHSFNGFPSKIYYYSKNEQFKFFWHNNGQPHRENSLPVNLFFSEKKFQSEQVKGNASDYKIWKVCGVIHNVNGPAEIGNPILKNAQSKIVSTDDYFLYGIALRKSLFEEVKVYQTKTSVPLYASLLSALGVISEESLDVLKSGELKVPITWLTRYWGLTDELLDEKLIRLSQSNPMFSYARKFISPRPLTDLITVVTFEEQLIVNAGEHSHA
jgi:hypothetical protein